MDVSRRGKKLEGLVYESNLILLKNLYRLLVEDGKKQLALFRLAEAVEAGDSWTEWFTMAVDTGWDSQQLAIIAGVPVASNVRIHTENDQKTM